MNLYTIWAHDHLDLCAPSVFSVASRPTEEEAKALVKQYQRDQGGLGFDFSYTKPSSI